MELREVRGSENEGRLVMAAAELARMFRTLDTEGWLHGSRSEDREKPLVMSSLMDLLRIARGDTQSGVYFGGHGIRAKEETIPLAPEARRGVLRTLVDTSTETASNLRQFGEAGAAQLASQSLDQLRTAIEGRVNRVVGITVLPPDPKVYELPSEQLKNE